MLRYFIRFSRHSQQLVVSIYMKAKPTKSMTTTSTRYLSDKIMDFPDMGPTIPDYPDKENEDIEIRRARLIYQSRKRGMTENGLLLSNFAAKYLNTFDEAQLREFDNLINKPSNDWDLYYWILGKKETPTEYNSDVMGLLKEYCKNEDLETRYRQPDLEFK